MDTNRLKELAGVKQLNEYYNFDITPEVSKMIVAQVQREEGDPRVVLAEIMEELKTEVNFLLTTRKPGQ